MQGNHRRASRLHNLGLATQQLAHLLGAGQNGRISLKNIKEDYCPRFGDAYVARFKKRMDAAAEQHLLAHHRDARSSYGNLIVWRNDFAHEGRAPATATFAEVVQAYEDGKLVIHTLATAMTR
jgi:hypothetical protein